MFKLPRDIAIEWFEKRRQLDAERQQQQAGAAGKAGARKDMWAFVHKGKQAAAAPQQGPAAGPRSELSELLGDAELPEGVAAAGQQQQQRKEDVYKLTPKELAMVGGCSRLAAVVLGALHCCWHACSSPGDARGDA